MTDLFGKERKGPEAVWNFRRVVCNERRIRLGDNIPSVEAPSHSCHGGCCSSWLRLTGLSDREMLKNGHRS